MAEMKWPDFDSFTQALKDVMRALENATDAMNRLAEKLDDLEVDDDTPPAVREANERLARERAALEARGFTVPDQVKARMMGIDIRPLICPECDGVLDETNSSPDEWWCPSCRSHVDGVQALLASDAYHAKRDDA
jgi:hypothetical protein